jgi:hypothetical protein
MQPKQRLASVWLRIAQNIDEDFLELYLITSQAAGLEPSMGRPFGVGKSTLAIWMGYRAFAYKNGTLYMEGDRIIDNTPDDQRIELMRYIIDNYMKWSLEDVVNTIRDTKDVVPAIIWDDVQRDCPAYQFVKKRKREMIEYLTMARQRVSNIIMTAPSMGDIIRPLRRNITWELIVSQRGTYEVQFIAKKRDFYNPTDDFSRLWYEVTGHFDPLPEEIDQYYKKVRDKNLNIVSTEEGKIEEEQEKWKPINVPLASDDQIADITELSAKIKAKMGRDAISEILNRYGKKDLTQLTRIEAGNAWNYLIKVLKKNE